MMKAVVRVNDRRSMMVVVVRVNVQTGVDRATKAGHEHPREDRTRAHQRRLL